MKKLILLLIMIALTGCDPESNDFNEKTTCYEKSNGKTVCYTKYN